MRASASCARILLAQSVLAAVALVGVVAPANDLGSIQYGARLRATLAGWDLGLSYYDGFDATPVYRM